MENQLTPESLSKIMKILEDHFSEVAKTPNEVQRMIAGVAEAVKNPGFKLIHFNDVLFTVSVFKKNMVEIHAMIGGKLDMDGKIEELRKELPKLLKLLPKMGVKIVYTYMEKKMAPKFDDLLEKYNFSQKEIKGPKGENLVAFYVEI
jgi:hypothetical protein